MAHDLPHIQKPCKDCPMRKDTLEGWLGDVKITQMMNAESFVCHKDTSKQCAGHMLLLKEDNQYYRTAKAMNIDLGLTGEELVFDSKEDCIKHHSWGKKEVS